MIHDRPNCYNCDRTAPHLVTGMTWCTKNDQGVGILLARMKFEEWCCEEWKPQRAGPVRANLPEGQRFLDVD